MYHLGEWGTICDDEFDDNALSKTSGYKNGAYVRGTETDWNGGTGRIWARLIYCDGTESHIDGCRKT